MKRLLVVGSGGREHALAWAIARSPQAEKVYIAPGNAGTSWEEVPATQETPRLAAAENVPIAIHDFPALIDFAKKNQIDVTVVGPEAPLADGIVNTFIEADVPIFGPTREATRLESSKSFARDFMMKHNIPSANYACFDDYNEAKSYLDSQGDVPIVVKADGLAAGKGVIVCEGRDEAYDAIHRMMVDQEFGRAGARVVIEERMYGREVSMLAICDGKTFFTMPPARDHKPIYENDQGPNTGGMGAYTHPPDVDGAMQQYIAQKIISPTLEGMAKNGTPYKGVLYAGLMLTETGPRLLEFNCRFGDPEIQAIIPLLSSDIIDILLGCVHGTLDKVDVRFYQAVGATIVLSSPGYPGDYPKGLPIEGLEKLDSLTNVMAFHAGTAYQDGRLVTNGGRVLAVSAIGEDLPSALERAYEGVAHIHFDGMHYRKDIGRRDI